MIKSPIGRTHLLTIAIAFYFVQSLVACANIVPPSGGPRDTIPPYRIAAKPKDSSIGVNPKEILIGFNEYINTVSLQENLIVGPGLKNIPLVESKLNTLRIRINDTLLPNTTYRIQFGNAVRDVNEGNIVQNFSYVFSTGDHIDSGRIQGKVQLAETGRVDSTLIVVLHPMGNDSAIFKNKPIYYSKLNGKGKFSFDFLPNQAFQIFVLPNDYTKKYDDSTKIFGFYNSPVIANQSKDSVQIFAFQAYPKAEKRKSSASNNKPVKRNTASLKYSKLMDGNEQDVLQPMKLVFDTPIHLNDSFPIQLYDTNFKNAEDINVYVDSAAPNTLVIENEWANATKYKLLIPQNAISDSLHNKLVKTDTVSFATKPNKAYGSCVIRLSGLELYTQPVLLLTQDEKVKFSFPLKQNLLNIPLLPAGEFQLKLLQDENQNGKWDTGHYKLGQQTKQPEKVLVLPNKLNIRADWDNELNLTIK
ncbi:MAG: hypothetical protein RLZ56_499 [Bacteroidota bacterium]